VGVEAALRKEMRRLAAGPMLAAEAGAGEADARSRPDDQDEPRDGPPREPTEALGGQLEPARERRRRGTHAPTVEAGRARQRTTTWTRWIAVLQKPSKF